MVKESSLSLVWLQLLLWCRFYPWPGNFCIGCMLIYHMAVQVFWIICFMFTELTQVLFITAVLLEMQVEFTA